MFRFLLCLTCALSFLAGQDATFPLESVNLEGTSLSKQFVMELAGLKIGAPINKDGIEVSCARLQETGIFQSINYRYAPGPNKGYVLTLSVADQGILTDAAIEIPGIDENEIWQWLITQYPAFNHKVPANDGAQNFIARKIEEHLGARLGGQHLVTRLETDFARHKNLTSFQPEKLPRIASMTFTGQSEFSSAQLDAIMRKVIGDDGFLDRRFRQALDLNVRRAYEEHGMYRVRFANLTTAKDGDSAVAVTTALEEGPKYTLGQVQLVGEHLPADAMLAAAGFKKGQIANWTEIQNSIWAMERPLKRTGYLDAASIPERIFHDDSHTLDLHVSFRLGSFYHFANVRFTGLSPAQETAARKVWKLNTGDPFDFDYPRDFMKDFFQAVDGRQFKTYKITTQRLPGSQMDFLIAFEPR